MIFFKRRPLYQGPFLSSIFEIEEGFGIIIAYFPGQIRGKEGEELISRLHATGAYLATHLR